MEIKKNISPGNAPGAFRGASLALRPVLLIVLALAAAGLCFWAGYATRAPEAIKGAAEKAFNVNPVTKPEQFRKFVQGKTSRPRQMLIEIAPEHWATLVRKRNEALALGMILTEEDSFVPAKIKVDGKTHKVNIRLKGDVTDHLEGDKWSFRVQVRGDDAIWGMKVFSIQDPKRSGWILEWIMYKWLEYENLIALRYEFIDLIINGKDLGIFALEESFGKELVENGRRREGPILKLDESAWEDSRLVNRGDAISETDIFFAADVISFQTSKIYKNETLKKNFLRARSLLNDFRNKKRPMSEVFDVPKTARAIAIVGDFLHANHALRWKNVRFYYNPVTGRIELIPYNAYSPYNKQLLPVREGVGINYIWWMHPPPNTEAGEWISLFFSDEKFVEAYLGELYRMSAPGYLERFFDNIGEDLEKQKSHIYKDGPLDLAETGNYFANRDRIHEIVNPKLMAKAYLQPREAPDEAPGLVVLNTSFLPIKLLGVKRLSTKQVARDLAPSVLTGKAPGLGLQAQRITGGGLSARDLADVVRSGDAMAAKDLRLEYEILGTGAARQTSIDANPIELAAEVFPGPEKVHEMLRQYAAAGFLRVDEAQKQILMRPGRYNLQSDLIFPAGYTVFGGADTTLNLEKGSSVISFSPVRLEGSEKSPFRIVSNDGTGRGLAVIQANGPSVLSYLEVSGQEAPQKGGWNLSGAVTFYESEVRILDSVFEKNRSEDLVNLVRSRFYLERVRFVETRADALDVDFGEGEISNVDFQKCGNDCMDLSGSEVRASSVQIHGAGDKGVSVGEKCRFAVRDSLIAGTNIGLASKDGSFVTAENISIRGCATGFAAYQKKPEFPGGHITAQKTMMQDIKRPYLLEVGSSIMDNGNMIGPTLKSRQALSLLDSP